MFLYKVFERAATLIYCKLIGLLNAQTITKEVCKNFALKFQAVVEKTAKDAFVCRTL